MVLLRDLGKVLRLRPVLVHVLDAGPSEHLCCDWLGLEAGHLREDLDVLVQGVRAVVELSGGKWSMSYLKNAWEVEKKKSLPSKQMGISASVTAASASYVLEQRPPLATLVAEILAK